MELMRIDFFLDRIETFIASLNEATPVQSSQHPIGFSSFFRHLLRAILPKSITSSSDSMYCHANSSRLLTLFSELHSFLKEIRKGCVAVNTDYTAKIGFDGLPNDVLLERLDEESIRKLETNGVPDSIIYSPSLEAQADRMDPQIGLSFPLHWKTRDEGWRYLFSLALIAEVLNCRPGDCVLDLASGPGWVTELLNRMNIRTVSIDLSIDMVRLGRERIKANSFRQSSLHAYFITCDALFLPFADESFDGVICMNALHHMPSYEQAMREIFRVLKREGRAAFAEPGSRHAYSPISQTRMRECGVFEKSVPLALINALSKKVGFTHMSIMPLNDPIYYYCDFKACSDDSHEIERMWQRSLESLEHIHSRFILYKSLPQLVDTKMNPSLLAPHKLRADITLRSGSGRAIKGISLRDKLVIRNIGDIIWRSEEDQFGGHVGLGGKVLSESGILLHSDLFRARIPRDVSPDEEIEIEAVVPIELMPGKYIIKYDMVVEGFAWFEQKGSSTLQRPLEVGQLRAEIEILAFTQTCFKDEPFIDLIRVRNIGDISWPIKKEPFGGPVTIGVKILNEKGEFIRDDIGRAFLPAMINPGEECELEMQIYPKIIEGHYIVKYDVVLEDTIWFEAIGSPTVQRYLEVR